MTTTIETPRAQISRLRREGWRSASKILAGLGHPGYGEDYAEETLTLIEAGLSPHQAVYRHINRRIS